MPLVPRAYEGPECPHCAAHLTTDWLRSGTIVCPDCAKEFEATAFQPPAPRLRVLEVAAAATPEGVNACANHARNAAITNCQRCGLFICGLCEMNVGTGALCPSCFDRARLEDTATPAATRYRDYASMARIAMVVGLFFMFIGLGAPFGVLSLVYSRRGIRQRQKEGSSTIGIRIVAILAVLETVAGLLWLAFLMWNLFTRTARPH
ncbi:MAG: hypothetical protein ABI837_05965 [Acidobacteriota bacterium]